MTLVFDARAMANEFDVLRKITKGFLENEAIQRLGALKTKLLTATESARGSHDRRFRWNTLVAGDHVPLRTLVGRRWKGKDTDYDPLRAWVTFDWTCDLVEGTESRLAVTEGVTVLTIVDEPEGASRKVLHFDVCKGGTDAGAAHPPFHSQFHGFVKDIPRTPTFIVSPVDVIDFGLHEMFQRQWRQHLEIGRTRSDLRTLPREQNKRAVKVLDRWRSALQHSPDKSPFVVLVREAASPFEFV